MRIEPFHIAPGAPTVLRGRCSFASDTHGIDPSRGQRQERFETDITLPVGAKVIHVSEPLTAMEAQVTQQDTAGRCPTAAVFPAVDMETVEVLIAPGKHDLEDGMELREGR